VVVLIKKKILTKSRAGIFLLLLLAFAVYLQPYRLGIVTGQSMDPSLKDGQLILIDRNYYKHHPIQHGDIVSCRVNGKTIVKRVYALPGEQVIQLHCDSDSAGDMIVRPHMIEKAIRSFIERPTALRIMRIEVDSDSVYLLGDGGMISIDSREFGPVPQRQIIGKVIPRFNDKIDADTSVLAAVML
jgi:signal peptidase I